MLRAAKTLYHLFVAVTAAIWYRFPSRKLVVIGVTGTDGKTTTTTLIYRILMAAGYKVSMISSVHAVIAGKEYDTGFHVTSPDPFPLQKYLREAVNYGDTHVVLEVTSHGLSQHRVFGIRFNVGVLTNITHEHLDWHGTYEEYLRMKLKLLIRSGTVVLNRDDAAVYNKIVRKLGKKKIITYAIHRDALVTPHAFPFKTRLPGEYNKYNCLAAIAACLGLGIERKIMIAVIGAFEGIPGRMEIVATTPIQIVIDFAHTPNAIEQVLKTIRAGTKGRLIHVFGSAGERDASKRPMMGRASSRYSDLIVLTEEDPRSENAEDIMDQIQQGIQRSKQVLRYPSRTDAIVFAVGEAKPQDTVIITGKGHEKSMCRGNVEYPWSDRDEANAALKLRMPYNQYV